MPLDCTHCGARLGANELFCGECGRSAAAHEESPQYGCKHCGAPMTETERFCGSCGKERVESEASVSANTSCPACGAAVAPGAKFCGECGHTIAPQIGAAAFTATGGKAETKPKRVELLDVLFVVPESLKSAYEPMMIRLLEGRGVTRANAQAHVASEVGHIITNARDALRRTQQTLTQRMESKRPPVAVCLLGTDQELPFARVSDHTNNDEFVLTDNFYGMPFSPTDGERFLGGYVVPEVPVSRIPTQDASLIERLMGNDNSLADSWHGGLAVSAEVWEGPSSFILNHISRGESPGLLICPPHDLNEVSEKLYKVPARLYFNVHGSPMAPVWVGHGHDQSYPEVLRPEFIEVAEGAIVLSEACYGAHIFEGHEGMGLAFLKAGAESFVGSTIIAWGAVHAHERADLSCADDVALEFYPHLDAGRTASAALQSVKRAVTDRAMRQQGHLCPQVHNTVLSFVHYGNPLARVKDVVPMKSPDDEPFVGTAKVAPKSAGVGAKTDSVLERVRNRMRGEDDGSVLSETRARLREKLDTNAWIALSSGRISLAELPSRFQSYSDIKTRLEQLLGSPPQDLNIFEYEVDGDAFSALSASSAIGQGLASLLLDNLGNILMEFVGKGPSHH